MSIIGQINSVVGWLLCDNPLVLPTQGDPLTDALRASIMRMTGNADYEWSKQKMDTMLIKELLAKFKARFETNLRFPAACEIVSSQFKQVAINQINPLQCIEVNLQKVDPSLKQMTLTIFHF